MPPVATETPLNHIKAPHVSASSVNEAKQGTGEEKHDAASATTQKDVSKANMIQLDPTDHPIFRKLDIAASTSEMGRL